jgi:hypothetical protein
LHIKTAVTYFQHSDLPHSCSLIKDLHQTVHFAMPPHSALTIPEVIFEIFKNMTDKYSPPYGSDLAEWKKLRKDLLSGALGCKAFKEPCLDLLWNTMSTLIPLLTLIPGMEEIDGQLVLSSTHLITGFDD